MTLKKHILTSTSHMTSFTVMGGILFSLLVMPNLADAATPEIGRLISLADIGLAGLTLFVPVPGDYIVYPTADKSGLAPGTIGVYLANSMGAGFPRGMAAGLIAGAVVKQLKRIKLLTSLKTLGSTFIYSLVGTFITGGIIVWGIGSPIAILMQALTSWLPGPGDIDKVPLTGILGVMTASDVGGPINKVATLFAQTQVDTLPYLIGGVGVAICTPPIGMGTVTLLAPRKYSAEEKEAGKTATPMSCVGITEGAVLFTANDPLYVIPPLIAGAVAGNIIPLLAGVLNHALWGGLIVLPVVEGRIWYIIAALAGGLVVASVVNSLKKNNMDDGSVKIAEDDGLDETPPDEL